MKLGWLCPLRLSGKDDSGLLTSFCRGSDCAWCDAEMSCCAVGRLTDSQASIDRTMLEISASLNDISSALDGLTKALEESR